MQSDGPSQQQRNPERLEKPRSNWQTENDHHFVRGRRIPFQGKVTIGRTAADRTESRHTGGSHAGQAIQPLLNLPVKRQQFRRRDPCQSKAGIHQQHVFSIESQVLMFKIEKAMSEQGCSHEQHRKSATCKTTRVYAGLNVDPPLEADDLTAAPPASPVLLERSAGISPNRTPARTVTAIVKPRTSRSGLTLTAEASGSMATRRWTPQHASTAPATAPIERQQDAFREQLANQAASSRTQRQAHEQFMAAS